MHERGRRIAAGAEAMMLCPSSDPQDGISSTRRWWGWTTRDEDADIRARWRCERVRVRLLGLGPLGSQKEPGGPHQDPEDTCDAADSFG